MLSLYYFDLMLFTDTKIINFHLSIMQKWSWNELIYFVYIAQCGLISYIHCRAIIDLTSNEWLVVVGSMLRGTPRRWRELSKVQQCLRVHGHLVIYRHQHHLPFILQSYFVTLFCGWLIDIPFEVLVCNILRHWNNLRHRMCEIWKCVKF